MRSVSLDELVIDPEIQLQSRGVSEVTVQGYVEALSSGAEFPPVVAFSENGNLWLADGFHRVEAMRFCGFGDVGADVREGTRQDAMLHAAIANVEHGKPMSQAEKREAGLRLLDLTNWPQAEIARRLAVTEAAVSKWVSINKLRDRQAQVEVTRNGTTYEMNVSNIGRQPEMLLEEDKDIETVSDDVRRIQIRSNNEWYTPRQYLEAARAVMGAIDIDPASSVAANENVGASVFYTIDADGLTKDWPGRVWLNPPYGAKGPLFVARLLEQYEKGITQEAILLVNSNATETQWFAPLWDYLLCFVSGRINFISNVGERGGSTHGSVFVYFGENRERFKQVFSRFGPIVQRVA